MRIPKNNLSHVEACLFIAMILCGLAMYAPSLHSTSFYFDDHVSIEGNSVIKNLDIPRIFNAFNTRFLVGLSFALNYKWFGLHPFGYRLINLLIHCLNAFLVYLLIKSTWALSRVHDDRKSIWPAFFGSFLFLCHPVQTEAVNSITQRFVLMGAFFYLLTLFLYIQYRCRSQKRYMIAGMASALAAMFCKEFAVTLPVMLVLYECFFLDASAEPWWKRCRRILPFFIIALIVPVLLLRTPPEAVGVAAIADSGSFEDGILPKIGNHIDITRARGGVSRQHYFLTELNVVCTYVRLLFLPVDQNFDYDYPISQGMDNKTALCGVFLVCLLALAAVAYRSYRVVSFGIGWFFIALSLESSFIPIGHVIAEYRLYLASVGFIFLVTVLIYTRPIDVRKLNLAAAVILIIFSVLTYQRNKIWKDDITLWSDTIQKSPHKARGYSNRGTAYFKQNKLAQAIVDFNEAIAINPKYAEAFCNRGVTYAQMGKLSQAFADFTKAIAINPNYAEAYNNRSNLYVQRGDFSQALSDLNKSIKINPENADVFSNRGITYAQQDKPAQALADFTETIAINPDDSGAYNNRSNLFAQKGDFTQALSDLNRSIEINPNYAEAYFNRANIYYRQNNFTQAIVDYTKVIELNPQDEEAYSNLVTLYWGLKEFDKAWGYVHQAKEAGFSINPVLIKALKNSTEINDNGAGIFNKRGVNLARQGELAQAFAGFTKAIEIDPDYAEAYNNRSNLYAQEGHFAESLSDLNKAIALNPKYMEAYFDRGNVYYRQSDFTRAAADYAQVIKLDPHFEKAYNNLISVYLILKEPDKVWGCVHQAQEAGCRIKPKLIEALKSASAIDDNDAEAFSSRGVLYAQQGDFSQAFADFSKAIEIDPQYAEAYNNRSNLYVKKNDLAQALSDLNKAIEINPDLAKAYFNRGTVYYRQNNFTRAVADYIQAIELNPHYEKAYNNLVSTYFNLNKFGKAWNYVHKAREEGVSLNPKLIKILMGSSGKDE